MAALRRDRPVGPERREPANGLASILVNGLSGTVTFRTTKSTIEILQVGWALGHPVPSMISTPGSVTVRRRRRRRRLRPRSPSRPPQSRYTTTKPLRHDQTGDDDDQTGDHHHEASDDDDQSGRHDDDDHQTADTTTTKPVTTTTLPASSVTVASDPIVIPGAVPSFVTTSNVGDLLVYTNTGTRSIRGPFSTSQR